MRFIARFFKGAAAIAVALIILGSHRAEAQTIPTTLTVTQDQNQISFGQHVQFTIRVTSEPPNPPPSGRLDVLLNGAVALAVDFNSGSTIRVQFTPQAPGTFTIAFAYEGNGNFAPSSAATTLAAKVMSAVSIAASPNPSLRAQNVTLTATVGTAPGTPSGAPPPTGSVKFFSDGVLIGTAPISGSKATLTTSALGTGSHNLVAVYDGDDAYIGSTSAADNQVVNEGSLAKTVQAIGEFMNRRNDLLLSNGPDGSRQIDRLLRARGQGEAAPTSSASPFASTSHLGGPGDNSIAGVPVTGMGGGVDRSIATQIVSPPSTPSGPTPFAANGSSDGATTMSFSASLAQMLAYQNAANQQKADSLGQASHLGGVPAPGPSSLPFDVWLEGHYGDFGDHGNHQSDSGRFGILYLGADYVLSPWLLVGALVQYDDTDLTSGNSAKVSGHGWMAGPYATVRLSENIFLQGRAAWGTSNNEVSPFLTYTDNFSTSRWLANATLAGRWQSGAWQFSPSASVSYIDDRSEHFVDTLDVNIPGLNASLGQFKAGPEISYAFLMPEGAQLVPRASVEAIWNFTGSDPTADFGGTLAGPTGVRARAEIGAGVKYLNGAGLDFAVSYDGIGASGYHSTAGEGSIKLPFN